MTKFKVGDKIIYRLPMYDSDLLHFGTILKVFKNSKVRITYNTWIGAKRTHNVEPNTLELSKNQK